MTYLDPTRTRLSDSFLLSDFMGCDSVYRYGYCNRFQESGVGDTRLYEGIKLAKLLSEIEERLGPATVCYGFISPELSQKIVKYQDPDKPSYHRWDLGAAADVSFVIQNENQAPIYTAFDIDCNYDFSRMITYAESEWICIATRMSECGDVAARKALYENRFVGERKPLHVKYPAALASRMRMQDAHTLEHDWRGRGWPQYHGCGKRQYEHVKVSKFYTVGAFLYDRDLIHQGIPNKPPEHDKTLMERWMRCAEMAGAVLDVLVAEQHMRVSIVRAYNSTKEAQLWDRRFVMEFVPPVDVDVNDIANAVSRMPEVNNAILSSAGYPETRIRVTGEWI